MSDVRLIDANALLEDIDVYCGDYFEHGDRAYDKVAVKVAIKLAPTIEPPVVCGEWKRDTEGRFIRCSNCKYAFSRLYPDNFCPSCGADMRGVT